MSQPIKVLQVISTLKVAGAEQLLLNLVKRLDPNRFEVHVCSMGKLKSAELDAEFRELGVPMFCANSKRFYDPGAIPTLAKYVREHNIDLLHTHLTYADVVGRIAGRLTNRPVVSTLHNEPRDYNDQRIDQRLLQRITAKYLTAKIVTVSETNRRQYAEDWHIPINRIVTLPTAIPMDQFGAIKAETPQHAAGEGPVITTVGRLNPQKAHDKLLAAAKLVLTQWPNARFNIVGTGHLHQQLLQQAEALGIADRVQFLGVRRDIPAILGETDIFVLSSLWEGLPQVIIEAMAAARPVVTTDVGGIRDIVQSGVHGLIVPPGDVPALANAIILLLGDEPRRVQMGQAGRTKVLHDFDIDVIATQYEALYESISNTHRQAVHKSGVPVRPEVQ